MSSNCPWHRSKVLYPQGMKLCFLVNVLVYFVMKGELPYLSSSRVENVRSQVKHGGDVLLRAELKSAE